MIKKRTTADYRINIIELSTGKVKSISYNFPSEKNGLQRLWLSLLAVDALASEDEDFRYKITAKMLELAKEYHIELPYKSVEDYKKHHNTILKKVEEK